MIEDAASITIEKFYTHQFSICSIITNTAEYALMKQSFVKSGFSGNTEYLIADNTTENKFDAYTAINKFLSQAGGKYIIIVHQDVRCIDTAADLSNCLQALEQQDPQWAVCGNAGGMGYKKLFYHLNNNGRIRKSDGLPVKVTSLDENLLIVKNSSNLAVSADVKDFHFYGTDICIVADFLGFNSYVIPFMVEHLSLGNLPKMLERQPDFISNYGHKLRSRFIQTSCTKFYLTDSPAKNKFYNHPFIFFWVKAFNRIKNAF